MTTILEIGYGGHPIGYPNLKYFLSSKPHGVKYHGMELPRERMFSREEIVFFMMFGGKEWDLDAGIRQAESDYRKLHPTDVFLYRMDGERLGFRDGVFNEVHLHYVVSQPDVSTASASAMINESYRVLVQDGHLIVTGENKPTVLREIPALDATRKSIEETGFRFRAESEFSRASVFANSISQLVAVRSEDAPYFLLIAQK